MCVGDQSKSTRYGNSECAEIGVKTNRNRETIIIVENSTSKKEFVFYPEDDQTLFYFENIFTNILGFYYTFDMNYGRKQNVTDSKMRFGIFNRDNHLMEISAIKDVGIVFDVTIEEKTTRFIFAPTEKNLLEMFKLDLTNAIKTNVPKLTPITTNAASTAESPHTFNKP